MHVAVVSSLRSSKLKVDGVRAEESSVGCAGKWRRLTFPSNNGPSKYQAGAQVKSRMAILRGHTMRANQHRGDKVPGPCQRQRRPLNQCASSCRVSVGAIGGSVAWLTEDVDLECLLSEITRM